MDPNDAINQLPLIRQNPNSWEQFSESASKDEDGIYFDRNHKARYALIIALQYDRTSSDEELLKFIVKNEIMMHRKTPGLYDSLHRSSFLLARYKNPANVFLFYEAKEANFDTYSGYHIEYIFSAGIRKTIDYVKASNNPKKDLILDRVNGNLVDDYLDEKKLNDWFEDYFQYFPNSMDRERIEELIDRSIIFGDVESGKKLIKEWYRELDNNLYNLSSYAKNLGEYELAIKAQKKIRQSYTSSRDLISNSQEIAELNRLSGSLDEAWDVLKSCEPDLENYDGWQNSGLGRFVIETALKISLDCESDEPIKKESFYWAHNLIESSENITLVIFQDAYVASAEIDDRNLEKYYKELYGREKQRIDEMFANN